MDASSDTRTLVKELMNSMRGEAEDIRPSYEDYLCVKVRFSASSLHLVTKFNVCSH